MRAIAFSLVLVMFGGIVFAQNPNQVFNGRIMVSSKRFPASAKSPDAYIAAIKKQSGVNFYENKEDHTWKVYFAAFLKSKLDDVEYVLKIVDARSHQVLSSTDQYTDERGQQTMLVNVTIDKKSYGVNRELLVSIESKGKILAQGTFKILGEGEHYTGKVDFSDDEANGKKKDDDN